MRRFSPCLVRTSSTLAIGSLLSSVTIPLTVNGPADWTDWLCAYRSRQLKPVANISAALRRIESLARSLMQRSPVRDYLFTVRSVTSVVKLGSAIGCGATTAPSALACELPANGHNIISDKTL